MKSTGCLFFYLPSVVFLMRNYSLQNLAEISNAKKIIDILPDILPVAVPM